jgi:hypothetical protein
LGLYTGSAEDQRPAVAVLVLVISLTATGPTTAAGLSLALLNLAERDGRASYPQFTARRRVPT